MEIEWGRYSLNKLIDLRIQALAVNRDFSHKKVTFDSIFPKDLVEKFDTSRRPRRKLKSIDYFIDRTWMRPRDIIEFVNCCIAQAKNKTSITKTMITAAESIYSRGRMRSLGDEWGAEYGYLLDTASIVFAGKPASFLVSRFSEDDLLLLTIKIIELSGDSTKYCAIHQLLKKYESQTMGLEEVRSKIFHIFYRTGFCGIKVDNHQRLEWVGPANPAISFRDISEDSRIEVHPGLYRVLGINTKISDQT